MADKNKRIDIRVSESDLLKIDRLAAKAKMSRTDFMVSSALNKSVTVFDGGQEIARQLMKLGTNVNQITALAHMGKIKTVNMDGYAKEAHAIWQLLSSLTDPAKPTSE